MRVTARASATGRLINALSLLDGVRSIPSAAVSFLVKVPLRNFKSMRKNGTEKGRFPRITFCEGVESWAHKY